MTRRLLVVGAALAVLLAFTGAANAATLGISAPPVGGSVGGCQTGAAYGMTASDPSTPFTVPAGGGTITQWQTYASGDKAGSSIALLVLSPPSNGDYTVVATDTETIPTQLASGGVASFTPTSPIVVTAGDTFALVSITGNQCYYVGGGTPTQDTTFVAASPTSTDGEVLTPVATQASVELDLTLTLTTTQDAGVQTSVIGSPSSAGEPALLASVVQNNGPSSGPITFTDQVPAGLQVQSAAADHGTCATSGQTVTCTITGLPVGQSATVDVLVTASARGSYTNNVNVTLGAGLIDPTASNNTAAATLVVAALPAQCIVPGVKKLKLASARVLLGQLGCAVDVTHKHSSLAKGLVISASKGVGAYPYHQVVTLTVSSGRKPKKRKHH
jgi:hypothetical protein